MLKQKLNMTKNSSKEKQKHGYNIPVGVYIEESFTTQTKKYFTDSVHIFAVGCALGALALFNLLIGTFTKTFLLVRDGFTTFAFTLILLFSYYSIHYSKDFRRDRTFNYGYTRLTIAATFVNGVYMIFECLEMIHELLEGLGDHEDEANPHDVDPTYLYIGIRVFSIRIAIMSILLFWTLNSVSLGKKIEDIIQQKYPKYKRFTESDNDMGVDRSIRTDNTLRNCSLVYFSLKILIIYELMGDMSNIWQVLVPYHLGLILHLVIILRTIVCTILMIGPFVQSSYILLQKNSPKDKLLEAKIKNELTFIEGVIVVSKLNIWTIEGMQRVCNIHIKVIDKNYDEIVNNIKELLSSHFTRDSDLTIQLDRAGA